MINGSSGLVFESLLRMHLSVALKYFALMSGSVYFNVFQVLFRWFLYCLVKAFIYLYNIFECNIYCILI